MDRLSEIRARCDAATPGPWGTSGSPIIPLLEIPYNAGFIAHSREDTPYLLAEVERLTARAEAAEARADAAIADLDHLTYEGAKCEICKHYLDEDCITCEFEWRGPQAGKGEAPNE